MTTYTKEQLLAWKEAGVLFEFSMDAVIWVGPKRLTRISTAEISQRNSYHCEYHPWDYIRPYRAPGHIQPSDGSAERPEGVSDEDLLMVHVIDGSWHRAKGKDIPWEDFSSVDYYIIMPRIEQ